MKALLVIHNGPINITKKLNRNKIWMMLVVTNLQKRIDDDDHLTESKDEVPAGVTDTMFTSTDILEDNECQHIFNIAPAEGNIPLSIFRDKFSEELAYPGIFLGQHRTLCKQIHYSDICKSELRRSDRRAAMCVEDIFYKAKKLQMKILLGKSTIALRKCKGKKRNLTRWGQSTP